MAATCGGSTRLETGIGEDFHCPRRSLWMAVSGDRRKPSEGVGLELYAWALAL